MPCISFIVPVYNMERLLPRALRSLRAQTLTDFEAILINDGSKDGSAALCAQAAAEDARFRFIDQPNGGVAAARNAGLNAARGEYIFFLDPDDWVEPDAAEVLYHAARNADADYVEFGLYLDSYKTDPTTLSVSGPQSLVASVARVVARLDQSALSERRMTDRSALNIELQDSQGNVVVSDKLEITNQSVITNSVVVETELVPMKNVPLEAQSFVTGKPAEGYELTAIELAEETVPVAARQELLDAIDALTTDSPLNIGGATEDVTGYVRLKKLTGVENTLPTEIGSPDRLAQHGEHHRAAHRRLHLHQRAGRIERASVCGCFRAGGGRIHPAGADSYRQRAGVYLRAELAGSHRHAAGEAIKRRKHGNTRRFAV